MSRASTTAEDNALTGLVTDAGFLGVNTADPGTTGASEATYSSGGRAATSWAAAAGGSIANSGAESVNVSASQSVDYASLWGASSGSGGGGYQFGMALSATITFVTNGVLSVAIGALVESAS